MPSEGQIRWEALTSTNPGLRNVVSTITNATTPARRTGNGWTESSRNLPVEVTDELARQFDRALGRPARTTPAGQEFNTIVNQVGNLDGDEGLGSQNDAALALEALDRRRGGLT